MTSRIRFAACRRSLAIVCGITAIAIALVFAERRVGAGHRSTRTAASSRSTPPASLRAPPRCSTLRPGDPDEERQQPRRHCSSATSAGEQLPGAPRHHRRDVGPADGPHDPVGSAIDRRLQPDGPLGRLRLPDHARRHQARLLASTRRPTSRTSRGSTSRHIPASDSAPAPDPDRVLGLRLRQPGRAAERDRGPRQPDGLHGCRRQHARHRVLGRSVRLLRAAAEPRRLRRHRDGRPPAVGRPPQGRHARHLLRRHQPALHRARLSRRASPRSRRCR